MALRNAQNDDCQVVRQLDETDEAAHVPHDLLRNQRGRHIRLGGAVGTNGRLQPRPAIRLAIVVHRLHDAVRHEYINVTGPQLRSRPVVRRRRIDPEHEATFARYLVRYLEAYRAEGIRIGWLTVQNEPAAAQFTYPSMIMSPEQQAEVQRFQNEKVRIRKELRDVRRSLDQDIRSLGSRTKFINIALVPILVIIAALLFWHLRRSRRRAVMGGA